MGTRELLLIVLSLVVVSAAVAASLGLYNSNAEEGIKEEIISNCKNIGVNAQQWYKKPVSLGGGGRSFSTSNGAISEYRIPENLSVTTNAGILNEIGKPEVPGYTLTIKDQELIITGSPNNPDYDWNATCIVNQENLITSINNN